MKVPPLQICREKGMCPYTLNKENNSTGIKRMNDSLKIDWFRSYHDWQGSNLLTLESMFISVSHYPVQCVYFFLKMLSVIINIIDCI